MLLEVMILKVKWFEVENFRSIRKSNRCYLNHDLTILAGKNESGKSNILKALKSFSNNEFKELDYSLKFNNTLPIVRVCYELTLDNLKDKFNLVNYTPNPQIYELIVERGAHIEQTISGSAYDAFYEEMLNSKKYRFKRCVELLDHISKDNGYNYDLSELEIDNELFENVIENHRDTIKKDKLKSDKIKDFDTEIFNYKFFKALTEKFEEKLGEKIPRFILFDSFNDILPSEISLKEISKSRIAKSLFENIGLEPKEIFEKDASFKRKHLVKNISKNFTEILGEFYKQDDIYFEIDIDGTNILFYIYDNDKEIPFRPDQRSIGFQWFLSFFLIINAAVSKGDDIILIDEPGLYLHPIAQKEILTLMENLGEKNQIIFTTHSPYLISPLRLDRLRLIIKQNENRETIVQNKIHTNADKETLSPIITAIGLDLSDTLGINKNFNIITEGISDYYYLQAMSNILDKNLNFNIIPSMGAQQTIYIYSILIGWGFPAIILLDNDNEGNKVANLMKRHLESDIEVIFVSKENDTQIEDLFTKKDFFKYILQDKSRKTPNQKNSSTVKGKDKVLLSKKFLELVTDANTEVTLSKETIKRFDELLSRLNSIKQEYETTRNEAAITE